MFAVKYGFGLTSLCRGAPVGEVEEVFKLHVAVVVGRSGGLELVGINFRAVGDNLPDKTHFLSLYSVVDRRGKVFPSLTAERRFKRGFIVSLCA